MSQSEGVSVFFFFFLKSSAFSYINQCIAQLPCHRTASNVVLFLKEKKICSSTFTSGHKAAHLILSILIHMWALKWWRAYRITSVAVILLQDRSCGCCHLWAALRKVSLSRRLVTELFHPCSHLYIPRLGFHSERLHNTMYIPSGRQDGQLRLGWVPSGLREPDWRSGKTMKPTTFSWRSVDINRFSPRLQWFMASGFQCGLLCKLWTLPMQRLRGVAATVHID